MRSDYDVQVQRYWINKLICRCGKKYRRLMFSNNGVVSYCELCGRKHTGIHDFGSKRFKEPYR